MIRSSDVATSRTPIPTIYLEDVSEIPFVEAVPGVEEYQHRARIRAESGSLFVASTDRDPDYETYNQKLGLGSPDFVVAEPLANKTEVAKACCEPATFAKLVSWAAQHPRWAIHPYMSIAPVWDLAEKLAAETGTEGGVIGPSVEALWIANDKLALTRLVEEACGSEWAPKTVHCDSPESVVKQVRAFFRTFDKVGVKRTRCASAMGNLVLQNDQAELPQIIERFLDDTQWEGDEPLLVVEWVEAIASPSTQLWLPLDGEPVVEGVYEQLLEGEEKMFLGSRPSTLPRPVNDAIANASIKVAKVLQSKGYVGRCSFDFVVGGDLDGDFRAVFTESNGRWGGTSTPMFLVDRLLSTRRENRPMYRAQDIVHEDWVGASFAELQAALAEHLYFPDLHGDDINGRYVLYNVGPLKSRGKFDVIAFGATSTQADDSMEFLKTKLHGG